jgi:two-component system cell cycle sensor histidine kinase/response regulator CckA
MTTGQRVVSQAMHVEWIDRWKHRVSRRREEHASLCRLIDEAPVAVFRYGISSGRLSYVNEKFAASLGYTPEEILQLGSVTDIIAEDQRDVVKEMIRRREAGDDRQVRYLTKVRCRDGTLLDAEIHGAVANGADGRIVIGAVVDMTNHVAAARQLREREEYFRALTEKVSDVIAIVSREQVLTYVSPSIEHVLGCKPDEILGQPMGVAVHPEDQDRFSKSLAELKTGNGFELAEFRFQHKNGRWRTLEVTATHLLDHPQIRGFVLNLHDVTERKRMQQELEQVNRLTSLGRLAAQMAHEFNNVLMGIQPMVEVIRRRGTADPALLRFTDVILSSIKRGERLTSEILRFARPAQVTPETVSVHEFLQQVGDELWPMLGDRVALNVSTPRALAHMLADRNQLAQVFINLALNARDAMPEGGTLTFKAQLAREGEIEDHEEFLHFTISDTGSGIAADDLPYIFEPLFTTKPRGTGLGLSIVFQLIAAHRGHVSVESELGKGTTFHLFLPATAVSERKAEKGSREESLVPQQLRVLLVEDEEAVASGLSLSLELEGIEVEVAATGADVLPAVQSFRPDLIVLDLSLPDDDGRAVYERVAARHRIPVIFSSGHAAEADLPEPIHGSPVAFLRKPYATDELLSAIHELMGEGHTRQCVTSKY